MTYEVLNETDYSRRGRHLLSLLCTYDGLVFRHFGPKSFWTRQIQTLFGDTSDHVWLQFGPCIRTVRTAYRCVKVFYTVTSISSQAQCFRIFRSFTCIRLDINRFLMITISPYFVFEAPRMIT